MVSPVELDVDGPLRVEALVGEFPRREPLQVEVPLPRQGLDALDQLLRIALGRKDLEELGEIDLQPLDLLPELGELALRGAALLDLLLEALELRALRLDLLVQASQPEVVNGPGQEDPEDEAEGERDAPLAILEPQFEGHGAPTPPFPSFPRRGSGRGRALGQGRKPERPTG